MRWCVTIISKPSKNNFVASILIAREFSSSLDTFDSWSNIICSSLSGHWSWPVCVWPGVSCNVIRSKSNVYHEYGEKETRLFKEGLLVIRGFKRMERRYRITIESWSLFYEKHRRVICIQNQALVKQYVVHSFFAIKTRFFRSAIPTGSVSIVRSTYRSLFETFLSSRLSDR